MVLVACAVLPHGSMLLDPLRNDLPKSAIDLRDGCMKCCDEISKLKADIIILSTPHGLALTKAFGVYLNPNAEGNAEWNDAWSEYKVKINLEENISRNLVEKISETEGIVSFAKYAVPLRWGEVVPLWFLERMYLNEEKREKTLTKYVIVTPPARVSTNDSPPKSQKERAPAMLKFGSDLRKFIDGLKERVIFVVSGDLSHVHPTDCKLPLYLPNPLWNLPSSKEASSKFDSLVNKWFLSLNGDDLKAALDAASEGLSCGMDGFSIIQGIVEDNNDFKTQIFAYNAPSYYGMMAALAVRNSHKE